MIIQLNSNRYSYDEAALIYNGAVSRVYKATDMANNRPVCLKISSYEGFRGGAAALKAEALALGNAGSVTLRVPCLIEYADIPAKKLFYTVMQYIPGEGLRKQMKLMSAREFVNCICELCGILDAIHSRHIYHKDVKPENIIISPEGDAYLIDFNISIAAPNLTDGTENYRAPEMKSAGLSVARSRSDIFSLGVMLYEYFTGSVPVRGTDYSAGAFSAPGADWKYFRKPSEKKPSVSAELDRIILKAMERNPEKRYKRAADMRRELRSAMKKENGKNG